MSDNKDNLTDKQDAFCREYLIDLNATQAAIRAGSSKKTARDIACENLAKPNIILRLNELKNARNERTEVTSDKVVREIASLAFASIDDELKAGDKLKALDMLGKHTGIYELDNNQSKSTTSLNMTHLTFEQLQELAGEKDEK